MSGEGALCRDCGWRKERAAAPTRCRACGSRRTLAHAELFTLEIAHIDCDAFYASVEKRDRPELRDKPLIIGGGGNRGVVTTACYLARIHGVRSAMPMVQARKLCPMAEIVPPEMSKYVAVSKEIRALFDSLTPIVEPLSLDEAFLDLSGTQRLHGMPPAAALAQIAARIEREIGVTVSVGLSWNKFLAKIASDLDKPRGFSIVGRAETLDFLEPKPVKTIWGVGPATEARLLKDGYRTVGDLRRADPEVLMRAYGSLGSRLAKLSRGEDAREITSRRRAKSLSSETTFFSDLAPSKPADLAELDRALWRLSEKVSSRMKEKALLGRVATLALKTSDHRRLTRRKTLSSPTAMANPLYQTARALLDAEMLRPEAARTAYRLIGVGFSEISAQNPANDADASPSISSQLQPEQQSIFDALQYATSLKN